MASYLSLLPREIRHMTATYYANCGSQTFDVFSMIYSEQLFAYHCEAATAALELQRRAEEMELAMAIKEVNRKMKEALYELSWLNTHSK